MVIDGSIENIVANQTYTVQVHVMETDMSSSSENAEIFLNGISYGTCDGGNPSRDGRCGWFNCTSQLTNNQLASNLASVQINKSYR